MTFKTVSLLCFVWFTGAQANWQPIVIRNVASGGACTAIGERIIGAIRSARYTCIAYPPGDER